MRMKRQILSSVLFIPLILFFFLLTPVFSEFKKVNNCELSSVKASVTGELFSDRCYSPAGKEIACPQDALNCSEITDDDREWIERLHAFLEANPPAAGGDAYNNVSSQPTFKSGLFFQSILDLTSDTYNRLQNIPSLSVLFPGLTIETGTSSGQYGPAGANYVRLGLGSLEGTLSARDILVTSTASNDPQRQILGSLYVSDMNMKFHENSYVTMYVLNSQDGVGINVDVTIDKIGLKTLSWGDADGVGGNTTAGYVGLTDTTLTGVTANGSMGMKADTVRTSQSTVSIPVGTQYNHIAFADLAVGVGTLDTTVAVGDKKDFSGNTSVLGTIYMKDLHINMQGYLDLYSKSGQDLTGINLDVTISRLTMDTLAWGDPDGVPEAPNMGGVGLRNLAIDNLKIAGNVTVERMTVQPGQNGINPFPVGTALVELGLQANISMDSLDANLALGNRKDNLNQVLGSIYLGSLKTTVNGSLDIHTPTPSTQGVVIDANVNLSTVTLNARSWGDADGVGDMTTAGYRGFRNVELKNLNFGGPLSINVATVNNANTVNIPMMSSTFVRIALGTGDSSIFPSVANGQFLIGIGSFSRDVVLDNTRTLNSSSAGTLRSFYMQNLSIGINGYVDIGAH